MAARQAKAKAAATPVVAIAAAPGALQMKASAGAEVVTRVRVTNHGKSRLALDRAGTVSLRRSDCLARGIRETFKDQPGDLISKLVALGRRLEKEPSPTAKISYSADVDALKPGESAEVEIHLRMPENIEADTRWTARVPVLGTTVAAELEIPKPRTTTGSRAKPSGTTRARKGGDE